MMLSTAVTSPEVEEHDVKMTSRFSATGSKPTGPSAPSRPTLLCLGHEAPQCHQPPETVSPPKYSPDQTDRAWRVARDGVSALARDGRRSSPPTRDGRTGDWAGGQAGRRAGRRAEGGGGRTRTDERASWRWSAARDAHVRASFAPSPPCDDGRLRRCACHHTTCVGALWYQTQTRSPRWVLGSEKTPHNPLSITPVPLLPCLCAPWRGLRRVIKRRKPRMDHNDRDT